MSQPKGKRVEVFYRKLGKLIAERRKELEMSPETLAKKIKLSRPALLNMEAGRQRIYLHHCFMIERALRYPPGHLVAKGVKKC